MHRFFVVEVKGVAGMPDAVDAFIKLHPRVARSGRRRRSPHRIVGGRNGILCEGVEDVGQHQFLVLLLVIEADFHQRSEARQGGVIGLMEEFDHRGIDVPAIGRHFFGTGAGQMASLGASVARAGADIIGIEQIGVVRMERTITQTMLAE